MALNPFLFEADYGGGMGAGVDPAAAAAASAAAVNPFLSDFGGDVSSTVPDFGSGVSMAAAAPAAEINPFLSYQPAAESTYTTMAHDSVVMAAGPTAAAVPSVGATNPFASFVDASMDMAPAPSVNSTGGAIFGTTAAPPPINHGASLFGGAEPAVAVDTLLLDIQEDPPRPPPASVPSSTQDLLDTVTGALEATSDSLLDRLRATQPSPVPQMVQPSPSPRSPSPDLLMGDEPPPVPPPSANPLAPSPGLNQVDSIMDLFDTPNPSGGPKSSQEILGLYNSSVTTAASSTSAPPKAEPLLDLLDSAPPVSTATEASTTTLTNSQQPEAGVELILTKEPEPVEEMDTSADPEPMMTEEAVEPPAPPPVEDVPMEQAKPQPMRPPPPPPAPKAAPPERPKPPPVPQQPVVAPTPPPPVPPQPPVAPAPPPPVSPLPEVVNEPPPPPPPAVVAPPPPVATAPEQRSPLPSRPPPPPVPPAPRVSPLPQQIVEPAPPPQTKSPSPPPVIQRSTTPSPTKPPPPAIPPQPAAPPAPAVASIFEQSAPPATNSSITSSGAALFGSGAPSSSPFASSDYSTTGGRDAFSSIPSVTDTKPKPVFAAAAKTMGDSFDAFEAKFSRAGNAPANNAFGDAFGSTSTTNTTTDLNSAWGDSGSSGGGGGFGASDSSSGFGNDAGFDSFLSLTEPPPVPQSTPAKRSQAGEDDFDEEEKDMSIVIKPKADKDFTLQLAPALAPPPKSPAMSTGSAFSDENTAYVPFLSSAKDSTKPPAGAPPTTMHRSDSQDSPQTPLYEEDQSQPLEDFPRITYTGDGWEMFVRLPNKKKITGQRFWKKVFVKVGSLNDVPVVQVYNNKGEKDPFQEIPLQPCYSVSEISAQQFDQYGKVFTIKLQYIFYKEKPGIRPGQLSKANRISNKLTQFAAYAIQGDYSGVKEFGSDLKKLGVPIEHSPQISQLVKLGTATYEDIRQFSIWIEENLFRMSVHRDRALNYKTEEIQVTIVDEYYVEQDIYGVVTRQIARVRLFFLSFLNGGAEIEMGVNDLRRQGKEIVGRHDIIPVPTEEWIRMEAIEFSNCVQLDEFDKTQTIKFKPPDACYIELMRFRVRPPRHRELPLQVKTVFTFLGQRIEVRSDILVPGFTSRKLGQIPCEDVMVRFPIPEDWIYMFRVEKHFRYGSVKSAHRRSGKVKGIERFLGAVDAVEQSLMETTSGQAKYEHHHKAIVWRIPRLPKEGQGAYTTHSFFCHITLQAHERIPENLTKHCYVEFTMPHTTVSHTVCRSISVPSCDEPPEKCCRYLSRHEYIVEIEHAQGMTPASYTAAAATVKKEEPPPPPEEEEKPMPGKAESDSDFSDD